MLDKLTKIANTLDQKGLYDEANIIDNIIKNAIANHFLIPDDQLNIENQGYAGGESRIGGGYSGLSVDEAMRAEDGEELWLNDDVFDEECDEEVEQDNVDIAVHSNGLRGNTSIDDQNSAMQQGLSDAYFYTGYQNLEGRFGPQDR